MKKDKGMILSEIKLHYGLKTDADFARFLEIKPQTLASWYTRNSFDIELLYAKCVDVNPDWLLSGRGEMLRTVSNQNVHNSTRTHYSNTAEPSQTVQNQRKDTENILQRRNIIPLYSDISSIGGNNELVSNMDGVSQPVEYIDTGDWFIDATAAIRHYGDSMTEYPPGCILALKEVQERQLLIWGENYVIETSEYRITKRIQRGKSEKHIKACSSNIEMYPDGALIHEPIDIAWSDIRKIFLVLGHVIKKNGGTIVFNVRK